MNQQTPAQYKVDEKAQIVLHGPYMNPFILRYKSVKKAEKDYKDVKLAWERWRVGKHDGIIELKGDMFIATVDLSKFASASFVDIDKRTKFTAFAG